MLTSVVSPSLYALPAQVRPTGRIEQAGFLLPSTLGRVTAEYGRGSGTVMVVIQDLHCHAEVQKNIRDILAYINGRFPVSRIFLEGSSGRVDTSWLNAVDDKQSRAQILQSLTDQGKLTGAEYYAAESGRSDIVYGLENSRVHAANVLKLNRILEAQPRIRELLALLADEMAPMKEAYSGPRRRALEKIVQQHADGSIDARKYYALLAKYAGALGVDINGYANITRFKELIGREKELNYDRISGEMREFMAMLRERIAYDDFASLLALSEDPARGEELYGRLAQAARAGQFDLSATLPHLRGFFEYLELSRDLNPLALVREENQLVRELGLRLCVNRCEREVAFMTDFFRSVQDYYTGKISADDYAYFTARRDEFASLWLQYTGNAKLKALSAYNGLFDEYYRVNVERNRLFADNCLGSAPASSVPPPAGTAAGVCDHLGDAAEIHVVVAGGFHTPGLTDLFRQRGISYLVITPNVTQDTAPAEKKYAELAREQGAFLSQSLALISLSQAAVFTKAQEFVSAYFPILVRRRTPARDIEREMNRALERISASTDGGHQVVFSHASVDRDGASRFQLSDGAATRAFTYDPGADPQPRMTSGAVTPGSTRALPRAARLSPASIAGRKAALAAPFWEWVYGFPFAERIVRSFAPGMAPFIGGTDASRRIDTVLSPVLMGCVVGGMLSGVWPFVVLSMAAYSLARGYVFAAAHSRADGRERTALAAVGSVLSAIMATPLLFAYPAAGVLNALVFGVSSSIAAHLAYNILVLLHILPSSMPLAQISRSAYFPEYEFDTLDIPALKERLRDITSPSFKLTDNPDTSLSKSYYLKKMFCADNGKQLPYLLDLFAVTSDPELIESINETISQLPLDIPALPQLQALYFRLTDENKKSLIAALINYLTISPDVIHTESPKDGRVIQRSSSIRRLRTAQEYIAAEVKAHPGTIGTIVDCCASNAVATYSLAREVHSLDERIKVVGIDLNAVLFKVVDASGDYAVFDAQGNIIRVFEHNAYWAADDHGWTIDGDMSFRPPAHIVGHFRALKDAMAPHLRNTIKVTPQGLVPNVYADGTGSRMEAIPLINPQALEWAATHAMEFKQGDFFNMDAVIADGSVDIAIVANVLGNEWAYYSQPATREALVKIGHSLREHGKILVGNNSRENVVDFQFHVYERRGNTLRLVATKGKPGIWMLDAVQEISLDEPPQMHDSAAADAGLTDGAADIASASLLAKPAIALTTALVKEGREWESDEGRLDIFALLRQEIHKEVLTRGLLGDGEKVTVTLAISPDDPLGQQNCALASVALSEAANTDGHTLVNVVFSGQQALWDDVNNNSPPFDLTRQAYVQAVVQHAFDEYIALYPDHSRWIGGNRWLVPFNEYLIRTGKTRDAAAFHAFIAENAAYNPDHPLAAQEKPLRYARDFAPLEVIPFSDNTKGFDKERFGAVRHAVIRGVPLRDDGTLFIGQRWWTNFPEHAGERVDIYVRDGYVLKVWFPDGAAPAEATYIVDNNTGKVVESYFTKLRSEKMALLNDSTIRNYKMGKTGMVVFGGKTFTSVKEWAHERIDIYERGGLIRALSLRKDGSVMPFAAVVDNRTGAEIRTFSQRSGSGISKAEFGTYDDVTIRDFTLTDEGFVSVGGQEKQFKDRPGAVADLLVKHGIIVNVVFADDKSEVNFIQVADATGKVVKSVRTKYVKDSRSTREMVIKDKPISDKGRITVLNKERAVYPERAGQTADVYMDGDHVTAIVFADGTRDDFVFYHDAQGALRDSFSQAGKLPRGMTGTLKGCRVGSDGILTIGSYAYMGLEDYAGHAADVEMQDSRPVKAAVLAEGKVIAVEPVTRYSEKLANMRFALKRVGAVGDGMTVESRVISGAGKIFVQQKERASYPERAGQKVDVVLQGDLVMAVVFSDGSRDDFALLYNNDGNLIDSFSQTGKQPRGMTGTLKRCRVHDNGMLKLGPYDYAGLEEYAGRDVEIEIADGKPLRASVLKDGKSVAVVKIRKFKDMPVEVQPAAGADSPAGAAAVVPVDALSAQDAQASGDESAVREPVKRVEKPRTVKRRAVKSVERTLPLTETGELVVNGTQVGTYPAHAGEVVNVDLERGAVRSVTFADGTVQEFVVAYLPESAAVIGSFSRDADLPYYRAAELVNLKVDADGLVRFGGRMYEGLEEYAGSEAEIIVNDGAVVAGRVLNRSRILDERNMCECFVPRGRGPAHTVDIAAYPQRVLPRQELASFDNVIVTGCRLDKNGSLRLGGKTWASFSGRGYEYVSAEITGGVVSRIIFAQDGTSSEQTLVIDPSTRRMVDSFNAAVKSDVLAAYGEVILANAQLRGNGELMMGGRVWAVFESRKKERLNVTMRGGVVTEVVFLKDRLRLPFATVVDNTTGKIVDSYAGLFSSNRMQGYGDITVKGFTIDSIGKIAIGGGRYGHLPGLKNAVVDLHFKDQVLFEVIPADGPPMRYALVCDEDGRVIDSFYQNMGKTLSGFTGTVKRYHTSSSGDLELGGGPTSFTYYPSAEVDMAFRDGKPVSVTFIADKDGAPILDIDYEPLQIDLTANTREQLYEKSMVSQERRLALPRQRFEAGKKLFLNEQYQEALAEFSKIVARSRLRRIPLLAELALARKAEGYMRLCRKFKGAGKLVLPAAPEARRNCLVALRYQTDGDYARALARYKTSLRLAAGAAGPFRDFVREQMDTCRAHLYFADAERLYDEGNYREAMQRYRTLFEVHKRLGLEAQHLEKAREQFEDCRRNVLYRAAVRSFEAGQYQKAMTALRQLASMVTVNDLIYEGVHELARECRARREEQKDTGLASFSIRGFYSKPADMPAGEVNKLLARARAALQARRDASESINSLAEKYLWLVHQEASKIVPPTSDYYDDLMGEGFLAVYDGLEKFALGDVEDTADGMDLYGYLCTVIGERFDALRKDNNRIFFATRSMEAPIGGQNNSKSGDFSSLKDLLPSDEATPEDIVIMNEDEDGLSRALAALQPHERLWVEDAMYEKLDAVGIAEKYGVAVEEVVDVLFGAIDLMRSAQSLGKNIGRLIAHVIENLRQGDPHARLLQTLLQFSADQASQLASLYEAGKKVTSHYEAVVSSLMEKGGLNSVEVWDSGYLNSGDAWSYATLKVMPDGERILFLNKVFLEGLLLHGPPRQFEPDVDKEQRKADFLELLVRHELDEEAALAGNAATLAQHPWMQGYNQYLARAGMPRGMESFHAYILELAGRPNESLSGAERALCTQQYLLKFSKDLLLLPGAAYYGDRKLYVYDAFTDKLTDTWPRYQKEKARVLKHHYIRNIYTGSQNGLDLGSTRVCTLGEYPHMQAQVEVRYGVVISVNPTWHRQPYGPPQYLLRIYDRLSGALVGSCDQLSAARRKALNHHILRGVTSTADGQVRVGGQYVCDMSAYADPAAADKRVDVELDYENGVVTEVRAVRNGKVVGQPKKMSLVYDRATGELVDSFDVMSGKKRLGLTHHTVRRVWSDSAGIVKVGGDYVCDMGSFANPSAPDKRVEVELDYENGVVTEVRALRNGKVVRPGKQLSLAYDNATGELIGSFEQLSTQWERKLTDHTVKKVFTDSDGKIKRNRFSTLKNYPGGTEVELVFKDSVLARIDVVVEGKVVDQKRMSLVYENIFGTLVDSFDNISQENLSRLKDHTILSVASKAGVIEVGGQSILHIEQYPGAEVELKVEGGKVVRVTYLRDAAGEPVLDKNGEPLTIIPADSVKHQVFEKAALPHARNIEEMNALITAGESELQAGNTGVAAQKFAAVIARAGRRQMLSTEEVELLGRAEEHFRECRHARPTASMQEAFDTGEELFRALQNGKAARKFASIIVWGMRRTDLSAEQRLLVARAQDYFEICRRVMSFSYDEQYYLRRVQYRDAERLFVQGKYAEAITAFKVFREYAVRTTLYVYVQERIDECKARMLIERAEALFAEGKHAAALRQFKVIAERYAGNERVTGLAGQRFDDRSLESALAAALKLMEKPANSGRALKVLNELRGKVLPGSTLYDRIEEAIAKGRQLQSAQAARVSAAGAAAPANLKHVYAKSALSDDQVEILLSVAAKHAARSVEAKNALAENYMWIIGDIAGRNSGVAYNFEELADEGYIALYEAIDVYPGAAAGLEQYLREALLARFDTVRKEKNKPLYGERSISAPVKGRNGHSSKDNDDMTLEGTMASSERVDDRVIEQSMEDAFFERLNYLQAKVAIMVLEQAMTLEQVAVELEVSEELVKEKLFELLAIQRAMQADEQEEATAPRRVETPVHNSTRKPAGPSQEDLSAWRSRAAALRGLGLQYGVKNTRPAKASPEAAFQRELAGILSKVMHADTADSVAATLARMYPGSVRTLSVFGIINEQVCDIIERKDAAAFSQLPVEQRRRLAETLRAMVHGYDALSPAQREGMQGRLVPLMALRFLMQEYEMTEAQAQRAVIGHADFITWVPQAYETAAALKEKAGGISQAWRTVMDLGVEKARAQLAESPAASGGGLSVESRADRFVEQVRSKQAPAVQARNASPFEVPHGSAALWDSRAALAAQKALSYGVKGGAITRNTPESALFSDLEELFIAEGADEDSARAAAARIAKMEPGSLMTMWAFQVIDDDQFALLAAKDAAGFRDSSPASRQALARSIVRLLASYDRSLTPIQKADMLLRLVPVEAVEYLSAKYAISRNMTLQAIKKHPDFIVWLPSAHTKVQEIEGRMGGTANAWRTVLMRKLETLDEYVARGEETVKELRSKAVSPGDAWLIYMKYGEESLRWTEQVTRMVNELSDIVGISRAWDTAISGGAEKLRLILDKFKDAGPVTLAKDMYALFGINPMADRAARLAHKMLSAAFSEVDFSVDPQAYRAQAAFLRDRLAVISGAPAVDVRLSRNPALVRGDAWALASVERDASTGALTLFVHEAFLKAAQAAGPEEQSAQLSLLAAHEWSEYSALHLPDSAEGRAFAGYLRGRGLDQGSSSLFHEFISDPAALAPELEAVAEQSKLLAFASTAAGSWINGAPTIMAASLNEAGTALVPASFPSKVSAALQQAAVPADMRWMRKNAPGCINKIFVGVYPAIGPGEEEELASIGGLRMQPLGLTIGKPAGAEHVFNIIASLPGRENPLKVEVRLSRIARGGNAAVAAYLYHPCLTGEEPVTEEMRSLLFGRSVLAALERMAGDTQVVQPALKGLGMSFARFQADIVELKGSFSLFAHPRLVNDEYRSTMPITVFGFEPDAFKSGIKDLSIDECSRLGLDAEFSAAAARSGGLDLIKCGFGLADVVMVDEGIHQKYPWLSRGTAAAARYPGVTLSAELRQKIRLYEPAVTLKAARSFTRARSNVAATLRVSQLRSTPDINDQGRGSILDLAAHLDELAAAGVNTVQLQALFDASNPFAPDPAIIDWRGEFPGGNTSPQAEARETGRIDWAAVNSRDESAARNAFEDFEKNADAARKNDFEAFCKENESWLQGYAASGSGQRARYTMFIAYQQLARTLHDVHSRTPGMRILFECAPAASTELAQCRAAVLHWINFGFGGVRIDLSAQATVPAAWLSSLTAEIRSIDPEAVITVVAPENSRAAAQALAARAGFMVVENIVPGTAPRDSADRELWLEVALPEEREYTASQAGALEQWFKALMESPALYIAVPDALRWGGTLSGRADFRNPSAGNRVFDITGAIQDMIESRSVSVRSNRLWGWRYFDGSADGNAVALPAARLIDAQALAVPRHVALGNGREITAPGLHCLRLALARLKSDELLAKEALPRLSDDKNGALFPLAYAILSETNGLRENEWQAGWQYIQSLERKALASPLTEKKIACALQMLEFISAVADRAAETKYAAAGPRRVLPAQKDIRDMFRSLLSWADAQGILAADTAALDMNTVPEYAPLLTLIDKRTASTVNGAQVLAQAREKLAADGTAFEKTILSALYLKAYIAFHGKRSTSASVTTEIRQVMIMLAGRVTDDALAGAAPAPGLTLKDKGLHARALDDILKLFDVFNDYDPALIIDGKKAFKGAVNVIGVKYIKAAA